MPQPGDAAPPVGERKLGRVSIPALGLTFVADEVGGDRLFEAVIIKEGVFTPGLGNPGGKRILFRAPLLARIAPSGEGKPVNLEHSRTIQDEVGVLTQNRMDADGVRLRSNIVVQKKRVRYTDAISFIEARQAAGLVPNVSIELDAVVTRPAEPGASFNGQGYDEEVVDAVLDGCAILPNGACSDSAGCGIGLAATRANLTLLALQGTDTGDNDHHMCNDMKALEALQTQVKALESDLNAHKTKLAAEDAAKTTLTAQVAELSETIKGYETADLEALNDAIKAAAPKGADLKAILGENPDKGVMLATLKAFQAMPKPAAAPAGAGTGRQTAATTRTATGAVKLSAQDIEARKATMATRYASLGLAAPDKSKLPASMRANTERLLAPATEGAAQA